MFTPKAKVILKFLVNMKRPPVISFGRNISLSLWKKFKLKASIGYIILRLVQTDWVKSCEYKKYYGMTNFTASNKHRLYNLIL